MQKCQLEIIGKACLFSDHVGEMCDYKRCLCKNSTFICFDKGYVLISQSAKIEISAVPGAVFLGLSRVLVI